MSHTPTPSPSLRPSWQGYAVTSPLPAAEAAPEPEGPQGEYNLQSPETPLSVPLLPGQAPARPAELLAPAGGFDAACAAFYYGADAIYLGLQKFSARAEAQNFTLEELDVITAFAHSLSHQVLHAGKLDGRGVTIFFPEHVDAHARRADE